MAFESSMTVPPIEPLTAREAEVFELLRSGLSNREISAKLAVSEQTVKFHLKNIFGKLGASGRTHAVAIAARWASGEGGSKLADDPLAERKAMEPALSPLAYARRTRRLYGDREAVIDGDQVFTYEQFFQRCDRGSAALQHLGVKPGDHVATLAFDTHTHIEQFFAVPQMGAVILPINHGLSDEDIVALLEHSDASVLMVGAEFLQRIDAIRHKLGKLRHFISFDGQCDGWLEHAALMASAASFVAHDVGEHDALAISYTSGTTLAPLGAMVSHRNAWMNVAACMLHWPLKAADRYLWMVPLSHGNGWGFVWTVTAAGAVHVCTRRFSLEVLGAEIARQRISVLCAGRSALQAISHLADDTGQQMPRGIRVLTAGASPAAATIERIESRLGWELTHAYGLSETAVFISFRNGEGMEDQWTPTELASWKAGQGVEPNTSCELRVVDEEGVDVPRDGATLGEIVMRGSSLMLGYYKNPQATRRAFAGGWFHTGDAAVMHRDGSIAIRDRFKDIIISGDQLIASIEVENALLRHPMVREVAVVGRPDDALGEAVHALVILKAGASTSIDALHETASTHLAAFKCPQQIEIVQSLPRTGSGKVIKRLLRQAGKKEG